MSEHFDIDTYFTLMKDLTGLTVDSKWEAMVKFHIQNAHNMSKICDSAPVDVNSLEIANTFSPKPVEKS